MAIARSVLLVCLALVLTGCELCEIGLLDTFVLTFADFPVKPAASDSECGVVSVTVDSSALVLSWDTCSGETTNEVPDEPEVSCQDNVCQVVSRALSSGVRNRIRLTFTSQSRQIDLVEPLDWLARERPAACTTDESFYYSATFTFPTGGGAR